MRSQAPILRISFSSLRAMVIAWLLGSLLPVGSSQSWAGDRIPTMQLQLVLRENVRVSSNLMRLSDVCELNGSDNMVQSVRDLTLGLAPSMNGTKTITRSEIEKVLQLRGIGLDAIRWEGRDEAKVVRVEAPIVRPDRPSSASSVITNDPFRPIAPPSPAVQTASAIAPPPPTNIPNPKPENGTIDRSKFTPAFSTPVMVKQSEQNLANAIESYLQTKTGSQTKWIVKPVVPTELATTLIQRKQILGVMGGAPPWDGEQEFTLLLGTPQGETSVVIPAHVKLPELVVAAKGPLAKGRILREDDLVWVSLPPNSSIGPEVCFQDMDALLGKQLKRSVSSQQPIKTGEVGPPIVVQAGETVDLSVVSGMILVETKVRAVESGAVDDIITIEMQPSKKRVPARVTGEGQVEIVSNAASRINK